MVTEIAHIDVRPGAEDAFAAAVGQALPLFEAAGGCRGVQLHRGIERPSHFVLLVEWDSIDDHTAFREAEAFGEWRKLVGPHFAGPPHVEHMALAAKGEAREVR